MFSVYNNFKQIAVHLHGHCWIVSQNEMAVNLRLGILLFRDAPEDNTEILKMRCRMIIAIPLLILVPP